VLDDLRAFVEFAQAGAIAGAADRRSILEARRTGPRAVTKGPILLRDFNKVDEDIFLANLYSFVEMVR
jgi:hypothetical protein